MTRGITPVIAIIIMLLMTVAAAGGFYYFYKNFRSSSESSSESQVESYGETSLSKMKIESVSGGKIYVRNTGGTDIDLSKVAVYVDGIQVQVNLSDDSIGSGERAELQFTQVPSCSKTACEVKVSGTTSASMSAQPSRLSCFSDADCGNEMCFNGVCEEDPYYLGPIRGFILPAPRADSHEENDAFSVFWNGTGFEVAGSVEGGDSNEVEFVAQCAATRNIALALSSTKSSFNSDKTYLNYSTWSGSSMSPYSVARHAEDMAYMSGGYSVDCLSDGHIIAMWKEQPLTEVEEYHPLSAVFYNGGWGPSMYINATTNPIGSGNSTSLTDFGISYADTYAIAVWRNYDDVSLLETIMYSVYRDGAWSPPLNISDDPDDWEVQEPVGPLIEMFNDTAGIAVWRLDFNFGDITVRYATWNGTGWSPAADLFAHMTQLLAIPASLSYDSEGNPFLCFINLYPGSVVKMECTDYEDGEWSALFDPIGVNISSDVLAGSPYGTVVHSSDWHMVFAVVTDAGADEDYRAYAFTGSGFKDLGSVYRIPL